MSNSKDKNYKAKLHLMIEDKTMRTMRRDIDKEKSTMASKTTENQTEVSLISETRQLPLMLILPLP
jgi:hypothetical protein